MPLRICFVCLGNICRSPTAEAVFRTLVERAELCEAFLVESAGTAAYHVGESPDRRSAAAAAARGITVSGSAQRFDAVDFDRFDHVIAMDASNLEALHQRAPNSQAASKLSLLRHWDPSTPQADQDVPDPYYGGARGFDAVLDICERSCAALLETLRVRPDCQPPSAAGFPDSPCHTAIEGEAPEAV